MATNLPRNVDPEKWGKASEKHLENAEGAASWNQQMFIDSIPWEHDKFRELLEKYSKVPADEVTSDIIQIGQSMEVGQVSLHRILHLRAFPGIRWNNPGMESALKRLTAPDSTDTFLEIGGFMCQTLRRLVFEGVDSSRLYGTDLHSEFFELGYQQFRDRDTLKATLVEGDFLLPEDEYATSAMAETFNGKISIAHASNFFHLFSWDSQLVICERIVRFFRPGLDSADKPALVFGQHTGSIEPGEKRIGDFRTFLHDQTTFQSLWDEVGRRTGTSWKASVQVVGTEAPKPNAWSEDARIMHYTVTRELR
ncbi:hypothetical protein F4808DRAFT_460140 [Astrocystis sublimbata]|nr:hypothetical protein F4808DRAFT_460140 [Astrocystis sublimbata]